MWPTTSGGLARSVDDALRQRLAGACTEVSDLDDDRAEAGRDWWPLAISWAVAGEVPARPAVVARPTDTDQVAAVLALCHEARVPVTATGGRSGVCGASVPLFGGVALDLCGLSGIVEVDSSSLVADLRAGTFGPDVESGLQDGYGLTLGHWPQSMDLSTVGGWLACRGAGQYSNRYGKIEDMVIGLEVVLADGRVVRTGGHGPRSATGPDLTQLFVGSEGTLGVITEGRFRVHPVPEGEGRRAFGFPSFADGLDACRRILRRGATPAVLRLYDNTESARSFSHPETNVLIVLDEADPGLVAATLAVVDAECRGRTGWTTSWSTGGWSTATTCRRSPPCGDRASSSTPWRWRPGGAPCPDCTRPCSGRWVALPAPWSPRPINPMPTPTAPASTSRSPGQPPDGQDPDRPDPAGWAATYYRRAWDEVTRATMMAGGAISHHHGIGINRARFLAEALGPGFDVLASVKQALDPRGILNPGKLGLDSPFGEVTWP